MEINYLYKSFIHRSYFVLHECNIYTHIYIDFFDFYIFNNQNMPTNLTVVKMFIYGSPKNF